jgi:hypothetical protein
MTTVGRSTIRQTKAGKPIILTFVLLQDATSWNNLIGAGYGTTITSTPPANLAAFAHTVKDTLGVTVMDEESSRETSSSMGSKARSGGAESTTQQGVLRGSTTQPLDVNFAVGKYVWVFGYGGSPELEYLSAPHLIT